MSSHKRRREIRKIRDSYPTVTLKELEDEGLIPKNFHLFDRVDMKEYQLKHKTDWWKKMSTT
ncbi:hypothetical protein N9545_04520 [Salibacteraceae bacterium]|nr:hypothetical protein [Salibacteraceae bacterium]MDB9708820.1 hypothetical protein [Salibacteraceae bacterium]MDC1304964.1 hypothetical protein [Salibacteraceae bacterium]